VTALDLTLAWARAFGVTLIVEVAIATPLLGAAASRPRRLALAAFAQLVSHPILWFVLPTLIAPRPSFLIAAELWAWLSEAAFYAVALPALARRRALGVALAANAGSLTAGLFLRALGLPV